MHMGSKNLAIRDDVYKKLLDAKKDSESFSDVIERLLEGKQDLLGYAGILATDREFEKVEADIALVRKNTVPRN